MDGSVPETNVTSAWIYALRIIRTWGPHSSWSLRMPCRSIHHQKSVVGGLCLHPWLRAVVVDDQGPPGSLIGVFPKFVVRPLSPVPVSH